MPERSLAAAGRSILRGRQKPAMAFMTFMTSHLPARHPGSRRAGTVLRALTVSLLAAATACDSEERDPLARTVTLTPAADNGAVVVTLIGAPIASVSSDEGQVFISIRWDTTRVVLLRQEPGPLRFDLRLQDPNREPVGTVVQVADGNNQLRADVAQYRVEVNE